MVQHYSNYKQNRISVIKLAALSNYLHNYEQIYFFSVRQLVLCKHLRYGPIVRLPASCFPKPFLNYLNPIINQINNQIPS